jgi:hypothetical protein
MGTAMQRARSAADGDGGSPGTALAKHLATRALRSPRVRVGMLLWVVGLFFMLLAPGLYTVTPGTGVGHSIKHGVQGLTHS